MTTTMEQESAHDFYTLEELHLVEPLIEEPEILSNWKLNRLFGTLIVAQALEERRTFDGTPRVIGADEDGKAIESPNYKLDTMKATKAQKELHNQMRRDGIYNKDEHDIRTKWGRIWSALRIDEIPTAIIYPLAGVHDFFGNTRTLLPAELESPQFYRALELQEVTKEEFLKHIRVGVINVTQAFGVTELTTQENFDILVMSVMIDPDNPNYPSKTDMIKGTVKDICSKIKREVRKEIAKRKAAKLEK